MSTAAIVEALKETPKGRLSYGSPLSSCHSSSEKLRILNKLTLPPSLSPDALHYITERAEKLSLSLTDTPEASHIQSEMGVHPTTSPPSTPTLSLPFTSDPYASLTSPRFKVGEVSMATATDCSMIGQICCELEECEQSLDDQMMREVAVNLALRQHYFREQLEELRHTSVQRYNLQRAARERRVELEKARQEAEDLQIHQAIDQEIDELGDRYRLHGEALEAKLRTGEEQKMELLRRIEERKRKAVERQLEHCSQQREEALKLLRKLTSLFRGCHHPQLLPQSVVESYQAAMVRVRAIGEELQAQEKSGDPDHTRVDLLQAHLTGHLPLLAELKVAVEEANQRAEKEESEKLLRQAAERLQQEQQAIAEKQAKLEQAVEQKLVSTTEGPPTTTAETQPTITDTENVELGMPKSMVKVYEKLQSMLTTAVDSCGSLTKDPQNKKYRFDLQKAVSTPVNAISSQSGEHLHNIIMRLKRLLSGQPVEVTGRTLSTNLHPAAKLYCSNLLAKKIVKQGEDQVASQGDAAFTTAAVAVGIWSEFPELGDLILAHFYSACPVLVPFYLPKGKELSTAEHLRLQGYKVSEDGSVESEDIFLKRMSGVVRLYAAIIQTPSLHPGQPHPHGPEHGWAWLARVLNMPPHPTLTATALFDFLETAGHTLMKKYGQQFKKLLFVLCKEYVNRIEKVTPPMQQGPLSRLKQFLEECVAEGMIAPPKGCLTSQFWRTRSHGIAIA